MRLFILYNLQLEIINFLYKNLRKANCYLHGSALTLRYRDMKRMLIITFCIFSLQASSQRRGVTIVPESFIGTWQLSKLADKHLNYLKDSVEKEIIRFTKDSVYVTTKNKQYAGTWNLVKGQAVINIAETDQFDYTWISGSDNSKFFTTNGLGYYKYFVRISKL